MTSAPVVSVVVPVFNAETTLEQSLQSLLSQSLQNDLEIIVVDDASTDSSRSIVERLSKTTNRIVSVNLQTNQGVHEARLAGIKKTSAPYVGFLDADDFALPDMFKAMYQKATERNADIVVCGSYRVDGKRKPLAPKIRFRRDLKITDDPLKRFCNFEFGTGMLWNKLYRKDVILPNADMHFPWRQNINEDLLLNIGCFQRAKAVYLMKAVLHEYVFHETSVTSRMQRVKAYVDTYRAYALAVSLFAESGQSTLEAITDMYRTQLAWDTYRVISVSELAGFRDLLNEATDMIYHTCPTALGMLASRPEPPSVSVKKAIAQIARKCLSLLRV